MKESVTYQEIIREAKVEGRICLPRDEMFHTAKEDEETRHLPSQEDSGCVLRVVLWENKSRCR
jgi:hypothetical protein